MVLYLNQNFILKTPEKAPLAANMLPLMFVTATYNPCMLGLNSHGAGSLGQEVIIPSGECGRGQVMTSLEKWHVDPGAGAEAAAGVGRRSNWEASFQYVPMLL